MSSQLLTPMSTSAPDSGSPPPTYDFQQEMSLTTPATPPFPILFQVPVPSIQPLATISATEIQLEPPYGTTSPAPYQYPLSPSTHKPAAFLTPTGSYQEPRLPYRQRPLSTHPTVKLNPSNCVSLTRTSTSKKRFFSLSRTSTYIRDRFAVNPSLHIPTALLSPLSQTENETRKNLKLEVQNGGIDVDIHLLGDASMGEHDEYQLQMRTTLDLRISSAIDLDKFPLIARIHTETDTPLPFHLIATAIDGYMSLHVPRSFRGFLGITVNVGDLDDHIALSNELSKDIRILSETGTTRSYFVGHLGGWSREEQEWEGDRVDVTVNSGKARLQFVDEKKSDTFRQLCWRLGDMILAI